jgi:hypothetical protein
MGDDRQNQASLAAGLNEPEHATHRGTLKNRSHRGLDQAFLDYFATVDAAAKYAIAFKALASSSRR